jgi:predicted dehydrogenase
MIFSKPSSCMHKTDTNPAPASETVVRPPLAERGKPRLGFVGVGWIGRNRLEAIARSGAASVSALCDAYPEAVDKAAEFAPDAMRCESYGELLAADLDGIVIATPSALHAEQAIAALRSGKAVFCQKPLARTAPETAAVIETAREMDRLLGVDLSYRHCAGLQAIKALVDRGALGDIYAAEAVFHNAYGPDKPWFYDARLAGGGCLLDLGIHLVDAVLRCCGCSGFPRFRRPRVC